MYVIYIIGRNTKLILFRMLVLVENNEIKNYYQFFEACPSTQDLTTCYAKISILNNDQVKMSPLPSVQKQMEEFNEIIYEHYPDINIKYSKFNSDSDIKLCFKDLQNAYKINKQLPQSIKNNVVKTFMNDSSEGEGNGLYNAGLYDNIKEFVNFRKDTKKTMYYLLQRIIALEGDMKTVKNKIVSNDIRTNLRNRNINLSNDEDDETEGNGFMCSRCGMINPKFFKNDYPTLSEFREQFSKL